MEGCSARATRTMQALIIFKDVTEEGDESEEEGEEEEGEEREEGEEVERGVGEVRWFVPEGFQIAAEPETLDTTLIGSTIYMRWETFGWQIGKITDVITEAALLVCSKRSTSALSGRTSLKGQPVFAFKTMHLVPMRGSLAAQLLGHLGAECCLNENLMLSTYITHEHET